MSYEKLKEIKFDRQYPAKLQFSYGIDSMLSINARDYPSLERVITSLQKWNRVSDITSKGAAVFLLVYDF
jgi:acyl-homoserine-lactone acylase